MTATDKLFFPPCTYSRTIQRRREKLVGFSCGPGWRQEPNRDFDEIRGESYESKGKPGRRDPWSSYSSVGLGGEDGRVSKEPSLPQVQRAHSSIMRFVSSAISYALCALARSFFTLLSTPICPRETLKQHCDKLVTIAVATFISFCSSLSLSLLLLSPVLYSGGKFRNDTGREFLECKEQHDKGGNGEISERLIGTRFDCGWMASGNRR